jgi:N utilization substance protein B
MGSRRKGREAALRILYFMDVANVSGTQAIKSYWGHLIDEVEGSDGAEFANQLVQAYVEQEAEINELIRSASHHWRLERMPVVDRNVLRVAIVELREMGDIPKRVTLNEAVELAKRFGSEGSAAFVNGVLDRIATVLGKP